MGGAARTVDDIAAQVGGVVCGDGSAVLSGVRGLTDATPRHLSFLANRRYRVQLATSHAGAVLVVPGVRRPLDGTVIEVADPYAAFAHALALFHPMELAEAGVDPRAYVADTAVVDGACIAAFAWIGPGAVVGPGTRVEAGAVVGANAIVGRDGRLMPHSVVCDGCVLGDRVWLNPGAVVGSQGFGFAPTADGNVKIPQVGRAVVEDDVEVGANTCVDRAALGETRVGAGAKLDNLVQVGHAAHIGPHSLMVAYSGVAGSSRLGERVTLAARATVLGHLSVGDGVQVGVASVVHSDVAGGERVSGVPAIAHRRWLRAATAAASVPDLVREVRRLQQRVSQLEAVIPGAVLPSEIVTHVPEDED